LASDPGSPPLIDADPLRVLPAFCAKPPDGSLASASPSARSSVLLHHGFVAVSIAAAQISEDSPLSINKKIPLKTLFRKINWSPLD
jgi:hypothetical protein